jgi:hypothetical protein
MTNRLRLGLFLVTAALVGGSALPTLAQDSTGSSAGRPAGVTTPIQRVGTGQGLFTVGSNQTLLTPQCTRGCSYPLMWGIAY